MGKGKLNQPDGKETVILHQHLCNKKIVVCLFIHLHNCKIKISSACKELRGGQRRISGAHLLGQKKRKHEAKL